MGAGAVPVCALEETSSLGGSDGSHKFAVPRRKRKTSVIFGVQQSLD